MTKSVPIYLELDEIRAMLDQAQNERERLIVLTLFKTGVRVSELVHIRVEHLDLDKKELMVVKGKGKKDRVVDLDDQLIAELISFLAGRRRGYLFESPIVLGLTVELARDPDYSRPLTTRAVHLLVKRLAERAGVEKAKPVSPHVLRHSYACHLLKSGVRLITVQKLLGHSSLSITQVYLEAIATRSEVKEDVRNNPLPEV